MNEQRRRREPSPSLRGKIRVDRRDESLFLFLEIFAREIHTFTARGDPYVYYPGFSSFFQFLLLKEAFHFFPNFTEAGSCVFRFPVISCALPGIYKFSTSWKECHFLPFTANFSQRKNSQKFTKMLAAGKPFYYQILQKLEKYFYHYFLFLSNKRIPKKR